MGVSKVIHSWKEGSLGTRRVYVHGLCGCAVCTVYLSCPSALVVSTTDIHVVTHVAKRGGTIQAPETPGICVRKGGGPGDEATL